MSAGLQKKVFVYSIQHTGTHFIRDLIQTFATPQKTLYVGKKLTKIHPARRERYTSKEWFEISHNLNSKNKIQESNLIVFACHHMIPNSKLLKSVTETKPLMPVVSPIRDPLLTANTFLFWYNKLNNNETWRKQHIKTIAKLYMEMLSIPKTHCFNFPVDLYTQRMNQSKKLFKFCDLTWSARTQDFINNWKLIHRTQDVSKAVRMLKFKNNKMAVLNNDIKTVREALGIEFSYLRRHKALKQKLKNIGYNNLIWY